jgi:hypothetical protein
MSYQNKYLKYKNKYLNLKKQYGGKITYETQPYESAGIIFTDNKHVLAGYQKNKFFSGVGGKKEKTDRNSKFTAVREMLEELFGFEIINIQESNETINENIIKLKSLQEQLNTMFPNNHKFYIINLMKQLNFSIEQETNIQKLYGNIQNILSNNDNINKLIENIITNIHIEKYIYHSGYINFILDFEKTKNMLKIIKDNNFTSKFYDEIPNDIIELVHKRKTNVQGEITNLALVPVQKTMLFDNYFITDLNKLVNKEDIFDIEDKIYIGFYTKFQDDKEVKLYKYWNITKQKIEEVAKKMWEHDDDIPQMLRHNYLGFYIKNQNKVYQYWDIHRNKLLEEKRKKWSHDD